MTDRGWILARVVMTVMMGGGAVSLAVALRVPLIPTEPLTYSTVTADPGPRPAAVARGAPDSDVVDAAPFRSGRRRPPIRYDPNAGNLPAPVPSAPAPRLTLTLVGVLLGTPPAALLRGLPGVEAAQIMTRGEELGGVRLISVSATEAVVTVGADTLRLTLSKAVP